MNKHDDILKDCHDTIYNATEQSIVWYIIRYVLIVDILYICNRRH